MNRVQSSLLQSLEKIICDIYLFFFLFSFWKVITYLQEIIQTVVHNSIATMICILTYVSYATIVYNSQLIKKLIIIIKKNEFQVLYLISVYKTAAVLVTWLAA